MYTRCFVTFVTFQANIDVFRSYRCNRTRVSLSSYTMDINILQSFPSQHPTSLHLFRLANHIFDTLRLLIGFNDGEGDRVSITSH